MWVSGLDGSWPVSRSQFQSREGSTCSPATDGLTKTRLMAGWRWRSTQVRFCPLRNVREDTLRNACFFYVDGIKFVLVVLLRTRTGIKMFLSQEPFLKEESKLFHCWVFVVIIFLLFSPKRVGKTLPCAQSTVPVLHYNTSGLSFYHHYVLWCPRPAQTHILSCLYYPTV